MPLFSWALNQIMARHHVMCMHQPPTSQKNDNNIHGAARARAVHAPMTAEVRNITNKISTVTPRPAIAKISLLHLCFITTYYLLDRLVKQWTFNQTYFFHWKALFTHL